MKKRVVLFLLLFFGILTALAQEFPGKGVPMMHNYTPMEYRNKGKIWAIDTAPNGIVYMAADKGLLEYDGKTWNCYGGSDGLTRSVVVVNDSLIYTGSDRDFGAWQKNKYGGFEYKSLYNFKQDLLEINEEFWNIYKIEDNVLFVSSYNIYIYKNKQLTKVSAPYKFKGNFKINDSIYFSDEKYGLYVLEGFALKHIADFPDNAVFELSGMYKQADELVLVTKSTGLYRCTAGKLFPIQNQLSQYLKAAKVFSFTPIGHNYLAFGTVLKGLFITDTQGNIIHYINKNKGLPNNTILSLHYSSNGKLWTGMDYGIATLDLQKNLTFFYDYRGDFGTGYTAILKDSIFYLGSNQGLYRANWNDLNNNTEFNKFKLVPGTEGQVWILKNIDNTLLIGHDNGLFVLRNNKPEKIGSQRGVWDIVPFKSYLLAGTYNGIDVFTKLGNSWIFLKKLELIMGSCNQLFIENDDVLWVNIPNYGVIRAVLDNELHLTERQIFSKNDFEGNDIYIDNTENKIQIITDKFEYNYVSDEKKFSDKKTIAHINELKDAMPGIFQSDSLNSEFEFFPVNNGFALKSLRAQPAASTQNNKLVFRSFKTINNENNTPLFPGAVIPNSLNSVAIAVIVPNEEDVLYKYKLNSTGKWSDWSLDNSFEFINLPYGQHLLTVRAMVGGKTTNAETITFRIEPPWYRTWYAYFTYTLLGVLAIYLAYIWQKLALKHQKKEMLIKQEQSLLEQAEKHKQQISLLEQQRLQAEYEQLKKQLKNKTIELATKAKENEDKNKLLMALREKCEAAGKNSANATKMLNEIQRLLETYPVYDDKTFEIQIDELHQEFFRKLKELHPALSGADLRFCAYLKIGLSSKEIADIMSILPSSVYISRSRLRKKLDIKSDEDLYGYLNSV